MRLVEVNDALAFLLEPWDLVPGPVDVRGSRTVTAQSGVVVDLNMARPELFEPGHLYVWPTEHRHTLEGAGNPPEEACRFTFTALFVMDREDEEAQVAFRRDVSVALDDKAHDYAAAVAGHRTKLEDGSPAPWDHIATTIDHGATRTFGVRGIAAMIGGYRIAQYA